MRKTSPANPGKNGFDYWLSAPNFYDNDAVLSEMGKAVQTKGESSIVAAEAALAWMNKHKELAEPFFAVVWFGSPHSPHRAVEQDRQLYDDQPKNMQHFLGEITGMDRAFGKIRDGLADLGMRENTILWYCSDNGALPKVGSTGGARGNKGKVYEGGLLVPAILEWPARITKHRITNMRCNTCDIYPTLLEIVGVKVPHQTPLDGISLLPLIDGTLRNASATDGFLGLHRQGHRHALGRLDGRTAEAQACGERSAAASIKPAGCGIAESQVLGRKIPRARRAD